MEHMWEITNDKEHEWWSQDGSNFLRCTIQNKVKRVLALVIIWLTQIWIIIWNARKKPHGFEWNFIFSQCFCDGLFLLFCVTIVWIILNRLVHCFARMSSPSHFIVSPHQNFCESFYMYEQFVEMVQRGVFEMH
jgi:hypothetical protein